MDYLKRIMLESDIREMQNLHIAESYFSNLDIRMSEFIDCVIFESQSDFDIVMESSIKDIINKAKTAIDTIIESISKFINDIIQHIIRKDIKKEKAQLEEILDQIEVSDEPIEMMVTDNSVKVLNDYIREMIKLERKVVNIKIEYKKNNGKIGHDVDIAAVRAEINRIEDEMKALDAKYDYDLLNEDSSKYIIKKAGKEAVKYADDQLDNLEIDIKKLENDAKSVLTEFKTDINGVKTPVQHSLIQKMSNKISERTRKQASKITTFTKKNVVKIIAVNLAINTATMIAANAINQKISGMRPKK